MIGHTPFKNRMKGKVDVWWRRTQEVSSAISIPTHSNVGGYIGVPFRSRMKGYFDILAPKRTTDILSPIHDTFVSEASPYSINGSSNNVLVGYNNGKKYEGLLKFNVQEIFPVYNKDAYILIDCKLKLTIANTRDIKDGDLDFYEVSLGDWKENSTTWANKPIKSNELSSTVALEGDQGNTGNVSIYIDMNNLVPKWLENPRMNDGIFIEARNDIDNVVSFYSKENGNPELNPQLIVTYIDLNSPFLVKNDYLDATVNVWENKTSSIVSEFEVVVRQSTSTVESEMLVLNKPGDLLASLDIVKDKFLCELNVISEYVPSELGVYVNETSRIGSSVNVAQINVENEVRISKLYDLEADLTVGKGRYLKGFLGINANRIVNELKTTFESSIIGDTSVLAVDYVPSKLYSSLLASIDGQIIVDNGRNLASSLDITPYKNPLSELRISHEKSLVSGLYIRLCDSLFSELRTSHETNLVSGLHVSTNDYLYSDIFYGRFADAPASLDITPYKNVFSEIGIKYGKELVNTLNAISVNSIEGSLLVSNRSQLKIDVHISDSDYIGNMINVIADYITAEVVLFDVKNLDSVISVQSWILVNTLAVSHYSELVSDVVIPESSLLYSNTLIINEHIKSYADVYVNKEKYLDAAIHSLAVNSVNGETSFNYGSTILNEMIVFVDKISVLNAYLEVYNEDWEYEQRRGYGYIM